MSHLSGGQGGLNGALHGLSVILSLIATVFVAPRLWPLVQADLWRGLTDLYRPSTALWLHLGCKIMTWPLTYLAIRMAIMAAFTALVLLIARWRM